MFHLDILGLQDKRDVLYPHRNTTINLVFAAPANEGALSMLANRKHEPSLTMSLWFSLPVFLLSLPFLSTNVIILTHLRHAGHLLVVGSNSGEGGQHVLAGACMCVQA